MNTPTGVLTPDALRTRLYAVLMQYRRTIGEEALPMIVQDLHDALTASAEQVRREALKEARIAIELAPCMSVKDTLHDLNHSYGKGVQYGISLQRTVALDAIRALITPQKEGEDK